MTVESVSVGVGVGVDVAAAKNATNKTSKTKNAKHKKCFQAKGTAVGRAAWEGEWGWHAKTTKCKKYNNNTAAAANVIEQKKIEDEE